MTRPLGETIGPHLPIGDVAHERVVERARDGETFVFGGTTDRAGAESMGGEVLNKLGQYVP